MGVENPIKPARILLSPANNKPDTPPAALDARTVVSDRDSVSLSVNVCSVIDPALVTDVATTVWRCGCNTTSGGADGGTYRVALPIWGTFKRE